MSPKDCYTDFHIDFCGSAVWYHLVSGRKVFVLAPPTEHNLGAYQSWVSSKRQARQALGPALEGVISVPMGSGDTLIIPPGGAGHLDPKHEKLKAPIYMLHASLPFYWVTL